MKGDFSRQTFDPKKHYNAVLMQQGRVQVDADWNEQQAIHQHRIETEAKDVIGQCGAPKTGGGFKIDVTPDNSDLIISPGRIYVDGILCELEDTTPISIIFPQDTNNQVQVSNLILDNQKFQTSQWVEIDAENKDFKLFRISGVDSEKPILTLHTENNSLTEFRSATNPQLRRIITYTTQPDYSNPDNDDPLHLKQAGGTCLVYLDVWHRHITALDEHLLREVALGGADTTTRIKTLWQVKVLPIATQDTDSQALRRLLENLKEKLNSFGQVQSETNKVLITKAVAELKDITSKRDINLQQLQHFLENLNKLLSSRWESFSGDPEKFSEILSIIQQIIKITKSPDAVTCGSQLAEWNELTGPSTGTLKARTQPFINPQNRCIIPPKAGYQRLENQLYRVEIHKGGSLNDATFKWSRDNGSVVTKITAINGQTVTVSDVGRDEILGFTTGQLVEVLDDQAELSGKPGHLTQIDNVDAATDTITLKSTIPSSLIPLSLSPKEVLTRHVKLRRWDSKDALPIKPDPVKPDSGKDWISLEGGIEVQFSEGSYKTGDYWLIPARTATGEIEWPPYEIPNVNPTSQPPLGIQHHYCRLAIVQLKDRTLSVQDCRKIFSPLTDVAIHVIDTNWNNDDVFNWEQFKNGLQITLDAMPVQQELKTVSRGTIIVTAEVPLQETSGDQEDPKGERAIDVSFILDGAITVQSNTIQWIPVPEEIDQLKALLRTRSQMLIRVTLKGHAIWSDIGNQRLYLDGQAFGKPAQRVDGRTPRTDLSLPSGANVRASDFESWFWLLLPIDFRLTLNPTTVTGGKESSKGTITLNNPSFRDDIVFTLSSSNTGAATVPPNVTIAAKATTTTFQVTTNQVTSDIEVVAITASTAGISQMDNLTVYHYYLHQ